MTADVEPQDDAAVIDLRSARLQRLLDAKVLTPFDLLKVRLDVVTTYAVPAGAWNDMERSYGETLDAIIAQQEAQIARRTLTEGIQQPLPPPPGGAG